MTNSEKTTIKFEAENEEKRNRDGRKNNVIKRYTANQMEEVFYVGSLDLNDPYSGAPIYVPSEQYLADIEAKERAAREQIEHMDEFCSAPESSSDTTSDIPSGMTEEEYKAANEIYERLMAEAAADELARQAEIEAIKLQQEASSEDYNAATGSYSGLYGKKPMSQDEADALASIMNTNSSYSTSIEDIIKQAT